MPAARRSVVVTGGAGGIGAAVCARLTGDGWRVVSLDVVAPAEPIPGVSYVGGDAASRRGIAEAVEAAQAMAPLRGWVNNAAVALQRPLQEVSDDDLARLVEVNLLSVVRGSQAAVGAFAGSRGAIVNISSIHAVRGFVGWSIYDMCKGAIEAFSRSIAVEYAGSGVRVNCVSPGAVHTSIVSAMLRESPDPDSTLTAFGAMAPMGRLGDPPEVASAVAWLIGDDASYVTGHVLAVDGGASSWVYGPAKGNADEG